MENENLVLIAKFCLHYGVEPSFISALHDFGLISRLEIYQEHYLSVDDIRDVERMARLHYDLGINLEGIDAIATLLKQIDVLQQELMVAKNGLISFAPPAAGDDHNQINP
ncbi:chaperone modulator CbpM [Pedobacter psychroterrae]|uniref:MerR family transcriptional regulator n=1 Tax=Pedobacter psychroterrae TaxID=2530453 RepID=A0A4R0NMR5_9SPHI|nr:chaperone modulator CbpM [Pedobacter psychroterrae]TCD01519.1 MerR family transcriptional regulator [Pedobacter psychroterrae]